MCLGLVASFGKRNLFDEFNLQLHFDLLKLQVDEVGDDVGWDSFVGK